MKLFESAEAFSRSSGEVQAAMILDSVRRHMADLLALESPEELDVDAPFRDLGLESLEVHMLLLDLEHSSGLKFERTALVEYPTVRALASHIHSRLIAETTRSQPVDPR